MRETRAILIFCIILRNDATPGLSSFVVRSGTNRFCPALSLSLSFSLFSQLLPRRVEFRVSGGERRTSPRRSSLTRCLRGFRHRPRGFVCSVNNDTGLEVGSLHKLCNVRSLDQARLCFSISFEVLGKFIPNSQQCSSTPLIAIVAVGNLINLNLIIMNNEFNK